MNRLRGMDPHQQRSHLVMSALEGMGATLARDETADHEMWIATVGTYRAYGITPLAAARLLLKRILRDAQED